MGFAPPLHNGFAFLASAHGCARLATNTPYIGSQPHAILLGGMLAQRDDVPVWLCDSRMHALLPKGDESAMNFEGLGTFFRHIYCFPLHVFELGVALRREGAARQWEPKEPHRARPYRRGLRGSFHTSSALLVPFDNGMEGMGDRRFGGPPLLGEYQRRLSAQRRQRYDASVPSPYSST